MITTTTVTATENSKTEDDEESATTPAALRIASLLPSTTDICISLGLERNIVGITHECDFPSSSHPLYSSAAPLIVDAGIHLSNSNIDSAGKKKLNEHPPSSSSPSSSPLTLTVSQIDPHLQSQSEIDAAVKSSVHNGISLYHLHESSLTDAQPSVILTQSLCDVCAVATVDVHAQVACRFRPGHECRVVSLEPESLTEVVDTFVTVAEACGVAERGAALRAQFWEGMERIAQATSLSQRRRGHRPTVLFFEWLDPPFDAGHWIPDMLARAGCVSAVPWSKNTRKSVELSWEQIYDCDPDVVVVGCCGFDRQRNAEDARAARRWLAPLRACREGRVFAADGNLYFARPGPGLREGVALLARCAYDGDGEVMAALEGLAYLPREEEGWSRVDLSAAEEKSSCSSASSSSSLIPDMEDLVINVAENYAQVHDEACRAGADYYKDPKTGYNVYTEYAHKNRGKCCGSGCRHCYYNHENVKDKVMRIQQPAFLYEGKEEEEDSGGGGCLSFAPVSSILPQSPIKILFFSGGKDSFLALRHLAKERQRRRATASAPFQLILLTTFDAKSRVIAHQEVPISTVLRQARHLEIPLLAVPLHRSSGETYLQRIEKGIAAVLRRVCRDAAPPLRPTLVFGDLHLDHIRDWRESELGPHYTLEYPLWHLPYKVLMDDLEASGIQVVVSAANKEGVRVGQRFTRELWHDVVRLGMDGFGEEGEFHSVAEVWTVTREQALGLSG